MSGTEPYNGRDINKWMVARYRPAQLATADGSSRLYELPNGNTVLIPGPSSERHPVSNWMAKNIAASLGMSFDEFREAIGFPTVKHGHPSRKPVKVEKKGCTKAEVLQRAADLRRVSFDLEAKLRQGAPRDSAFYLDLHARLVAALAEMNHAIERTSKVGAPNGR